MEHGKLAFVNPETKAPMWLTDSTFGDCFSKWKPELVFLQACEGAASNYYRDFRGVALTLVHCEIPNVVAMQFPVQNQAATKFAETVYIHLAQGDYIDEAVQAGREALGTLLGEQNYADRRFGSPVIYLQEPGGFLLVTTPRSDAGRGANEDLNPKLYCPHCQALAGPPARRCTGCGKWIERCPKCRKFIPLEAPYCAYCDWSRGTQASRAPINAAEAPAATMATPRRGFHTPEASGFGALRGAFGQTVASERNRPSGQTALEIQSDSMASEDSV
jgi:hypothetical protein